MTLPNTFNVLVSYFKIYKTKETKNFRIESYSNKLLECLKKSKAEEKANFVSFQNLSLTNPGAFRWTSQI